jgi:hypothetical protein
MSTAELQKQKESLTEQQLETIKSMRGGESPDHINKWIV